MGETPLHIADNAMIAQLLLNKGASTSTKDKKGNTPLHLAASKDNSEIVTLLAPQSDLSQVDTSSVILLQWPLSLDLLGGQ